MKKKINVFQMQALPEKIIILDNKNRLWVNRGEGWRQIELPDEPTELHPDFSEEEIYSNGDEA